MAAPTDTRRALSARGVARLVGVSPDTVLAEIRAGRLKAARLGVRRLVIRPEDVERWLESRLVRPSSHAQRVVEKVLRREEARPGP